MMTMEHARPRARTGAAFRAAALTAGLLGVWAGTSAAQGTPTRVMIRATAHDAKILGSGVGGALISVIDARTGALLARGKQEGGTGDTGALVTSPRMRGVSVYDTEGAAGFLAELMLVHPTQVRIEAEGPLGTPHAVQRASRTVLLVPGVDVLGDGIVLELYGFAVELLEPVTSPKELAGQVIPVRARVTMLCGCPTEPGGTWDSDAYRIEARIVDSAGAIVEQTRLAFSGESSIYEGSIAIPVGDGLTLQLLALDPAKANFGMAAIPFESEGTGQSSD